MSLRSEEYEDLLAAQKQQVDTALEQKRKSVLEAEKAGKTPPQLDLTLKLQPLPNNQILYFGTHVYVFAEEVKYAEVVKDMVQRVEKTRRQPRHLHIYCHKLILESVTDHVGMRETYFMPDRMVTTDEGKVGDLELASVFIFTAEFNTLDGLLLFGRTNCVFNIFFDSRSHAGPLKINRNQHLILDGKNCDDLRCIPTHMHHNLTDGDSVGVKFMLTGQGEGTPAVKMELIQSVNINELRTITFSEYEHLGPDVRRLQLMPWFLELLFNSACTKLMGEKPEIDGVINRLQFLKRLVRDAPTYVNLSKDSDTILSFLSLPRDIPRQLSEPGSLFESDWYFTPVNRVQSLKDALQPAMANMQSADDRLHLDTKFHEMKSLILLTSSNLLNAVGTAVGVNVTEVQIQDAIRNAKHLTHMAESQQDALQNREADLKAVADRFSSGLEAYERKKKQEAMLTTAKAVLELGISVGAALYTGGAGLPVTVHAANAVLAGAKSYEEKSRIWLAVKALLKALVKVAPKMSDAMNAQKRFSAKNEDSNVIDVENRTRGLTKVLLAKKVNDAVDFGGLLAAWREMDISIVATFESIKSFVAPERIDGLSEYQTAMRNVCVRGETLTNGLREAHEARSRCFALQAEKNAKEDTVSEIESAAKLAQAHREFGDAAFMCLQQELETELLNQRRRIFVRLLEAVLALLYSSNEVKYQKLNFSALSPTMDTKQLQSQYALLAKQAIDDNQPQDMKLTLTAKDIFLPGWQALLSDQYQAPFDIPIKLSAFDRQHCMRMTKIWFTFEGLKRQDGTDKDIDNVMYKLYLGPYMKDRASPSKGISGSGFGIVQYYMPEKLLVKRGEFGQLVDDQTQFARRAVCCSGRLAFDKPESRSAEDWDLSTILDIKVHIRYQAVSY